MNGNLVIKGRMPTRLKPRAIEYFDFDAIPDLPGYTLISVASPDFLYKIVIPQEANVEPLLAFLQGTRSAA